MREGLTGKYVGSRVRRVEDRRLLTGRGRYIDDLVVPGMAHAAFLRSPHPHALIRSVDTAAAERLDGVFLVLTGADMKRLTNPFMGLMATEGMYDPVFWCLATDRARLVGDPVAIVVATSRRLAEDACELIEVDYETIDAVADMDQARDPARPPIWPKAGSNVLWEASEDYGDVDAVFAGAHRVIREEFAQHRQSNQPMETRGSLAEIDPATGQLIFHSATQSTHSLKWSLALMLERTPVWRSLRELATHWERVTKFAAGARAFLRDHPELKEVSKSSQPAMIEQLRREPKRLIHMAESYLGLLAKGPSRRPEVQAHDIGGAFGAKGLVQREDVALATAALLLNRSVKWTEDRNEHLTVGGQAREETLGIEMAVNDDGLILGFKVHMTMDIGAYPGFPFGAAFFSQMVKVMMPGPYRVKALRFDTTITGSNKGTYVAYRGPWAAETWVRERMIDVVARELGLSPADVRATNMYRADELPAAMVTGPPLDVRMSAHRTLTEALQAADADGWKAKQEAARAEGKILGLGVATFIEAAPGPPRFFDYIAPGFASMIGGEPAFAVLESDGTVAVHTQQVPHGQGHETTLAQIAADELGVAVEDVHVRYGNSSVAPFGMMGTGGSRSAAMAGGVVHIAARDLREQVIRIAADLIEADPEDIRIEDGNIHVAGTPARGISYRDVAAEAVRLNLTAAPGEAIRVSGVYDGVEGGWAQATHVCWVEVDLDTGLVTIPRYLVVEDCGELINPAIVDGQIRGGVAQGIGAVLYEKAAYNEEAVFQAGTFMDFLIPTAMEIPDIEIIHLETPSDVFANYRGVGEGGMIAAPAALTNAIEDALAHLGVRITEQHLPPTRILELAGVVPTTRRPSAPPVRSDWAPPRRTGPTKWTQPEQLQRLGAAGRRTLAGAKRRAGSRG
jgi:aerobic carbon-monoxide dehydrogenase large subunit